MPLSNMARTGLSKNNKSTKKSTKFCRLNKNTKNNDVQNEDGIFKGNTSFKSNETNTNKDNSNRSVTDYKIMNEKTKVYSRSSNDYSTADFFEKLDKKKIYLINKLREDLKKEVKKIPKEILETSMLTIEECVRDNCFAENFKMIKKEEIKKKQSLAVQIGEQSFLFNGEDFEIEANNIKDENIIRLLDNVKQVFKNHL